MKRQLFTLDKPGVRAKALATQASPAPYAGWVMLVISLLIFVWQDASASINEDEAMTLFFIHYIIALAYASYLLYHRALGMRRSWRKEHIHSTTTLLALFLVSSFALNRIVVVFYDSTPWLCVYLILTTSAILSFYYFRMLPLWLNRVQYALLGAAIVLFLYLTILLTSVYPWGFLGSVALGIGSHVFVPLLMLIGCISVAYHHGNIRNFSFRWLSGGALAVCIFVSAFVFEWSTRVSRVEKLANESVMVSESQLPTWVSIGQLVGDDWITERILKSDLVYYTSPSLFPDWLSFRPGSTWNEQKEHDPLVLIANHVARSTLSEDERIKILKTIWNARHQTEERLWSGEHLTTSYVITDADIYPNLRIAYTEKYFNIRNNEPVRGAWTNSEEALYTFQLPEGSVVSALSLWIDGVEEKGILTSKNKADKAYRTIVAVERRDPSVVHWQEGNTVTVRVFPCTNKEERKFKIGVTTPLPLENGLIVYRNFAFRGPDASEAKETIRLRVHGEVNIQTPNGFKRNDRGEFVAEQSFDPDFEFSFAAPELTSQSFSFSGNTYSVLEYTPVFEKKIFESIFLDINRSWSADELQAAQSALEQYNVYVHDGTKFIRLTRDNWTSQTTALQKRNFSLFPFYLLQDLDRSLVITKGDAFTPHLRDLEKSPFANGMRELLVKGGRAHVYNLEEGVSTYINSLREFGATLFLRGDAELLNSILTEKRFVKSMEDEDTIVIADAGMIIKKTQTGVQEVSDDQAPDHVARLFIYNNIMRTIGSDYLRGEISDDVVSKAVMGYVVTPVSSLIVLESQHDYERFDIRDTGDSLLNAARESSGAVPEPHEWALIVMFLLFVAFIKVRN